ncbi:SDR family oxidoreductase [Acaryochloris sp. CCMEE 5410]|nr:SDR family oxidoreductase [Acaryochloris sp. CCMEE 5410]
MPITGRLLRLVLAQEGQSRSDLSGPFEQIKSSVDSKLLGQVNLFQVGNKYVREGGSITLSSGYLAQHPMEGGAVISLVNAALDAFAKAAAFELGSSLRVNTVSPRFVKETMEKMGMDSSSGISAADTAKAYKYAVEISEFGQAFDIADYL